MMDNGYGYSVIIVENGKQTEETVCANYRELVNLVTNLDRSKYKIKGVAEFKSDIGTKIGEHLRNYKEFTKHHKGLEKGV